MAILVSVRPWPGLKFFPSENSVLARRGSGISSDCWRAPNATQFYFLILIKRRRIFYRRQESRSVCFLLFFYGDITIARGFRDHVHIRDIDEVTDSMCVCSSSLLVGSLDILIIVVIIYFDYYVLLSSSSSSSSLSTL